MDEPSWRRVTKSFQERFLTNVNITVSDSRQLSVRQSLEPDMPIWDAALVLSYFLLMQEPSFLTGKRVLELGAGCALRNLTEEEQSHTAIKELRWGTDVSHLDPPLDYIVASDCIYTVQYFSDLAQSLEDLSGPDTRIYMANEHRWKDVDKWWEEELLKRGFTIEEVPRDQHHPVYRHPQIKIFLIRPPQDKVIAKAAIISLVDDDGERLGPRRRTLY